MKPPPSLRKRAVQLLARREHSSVELRRRLMAQACAEAADAAAGTGAGGHDDRASLAAAARSRVDAVLHELQSNGLASDPRFAESRIHARAARFGASRIRAELSAHGIALSPEQLQGLNASEFARAWQLWSRRFGVAPDSSAASLRQARFLAGRGFAADIVRQVLRQAQPGVDRSADDRPEREPEAGDGGA